MITPDQPTAFAAGFPSATETDWRALVAKVLKGADFDKRLVSRTSDGIAVKPLYTRSDARPAAAAVPDVPTPPAAGGWEIAAMHVGEDPAAVNAAILEDLAGGVGAITLGIGSPGTFGLDYTGATLERALAGVLLDVCHIRLKAGEYTPDAAGSLLALWRTAGVGDAMAKGGFGYDPLGTLAATGALYNPLDRALAVAADLVATTLPMPGVTALAADGDVWHDAGATEAQELACVLATVVAYLRSAEANGVVPTRALPKIAVELAVDADQFLGIAKLRAARRLLARVASACGATGARVPLAAGTSRRMLTRRDPWVNLLRNTMATAAAAMGGADTITVLPFTWALGRPDAFARRIARNTGIVLQEESGLGRVADPAAGSWYADHLADELARAAWSRLQAIEAAGGMAAALRSGEVARQLAASAKARADMIATGKLELTGTSAFPRLGDDGVTVEPWPGETLPADLNGERLPPLPRVRDAAPFEALRDAADRAADPPKVFLATLGPLAVYAPRATFMRNFLAAGGIVAIGDEPLHSSADAGAAFAASGAKIACLVSSDAVYGELAEATAGVLKQAGAEAVYLAGRPKDEAALRAAGVDGFIHAGADMIETLQALHARLKL